LQPALMGCSAGGSSTGSLDARPIQASRPSSPNMVDIRLSMHDTAGNLREQWRQIHGGGVIPAAKARRTAAIRVGKVRIILKIAKRLFGLAVLAAAGLAAWLFWRRRT
jgi:hypothetical protein